MAVASHNATDRLSSDTGQRRPSSRFLRKMISPIPYSPLFNLGCALLILGINFLLPVTSCLGKKTLHGPAWIRYPHQGWRTSSRGMESCTQGCLRVHWGGRLRRPPQPAVGGPSRASGHPACAWSLWPVFCYGGRGRQASWLLGRGCPGL